MIKFPERLQYFYIAGGCFAQFILNDQFTRYCMSIDDNFFRFQMLTESEGLVASDCTYEITYP